MWSVTCSESFKSAFGCTATASAQTASALLLDRSLCPVLDDKSPKFIPASLLRSHGEGFVPCLEASPPHMGPGREGEWARYGHRDTLQGAGYGWGT